MLEQLQQYQIENTNQILGGGVVIDGEQNA